MHPFVISCLCHFSLASTREEIAEGTFAAGKLHNILLSRKEITAVNSYLVGHGYNRIMPEESVKSFKRLEMKGMMFYSETYDRVMKRNGYTISFLAPEGALQYGFVQIFVWTKAGVLALVRLLEPTDFPLISALDRDNAPLRNTFAVKRTSLQTIPIGWIQEKCMFIDISGTSRSYVVTFPNFIEQS